MVSKGDAQIDAPPPLMALLNFIFFDAGGFFLMGFQKRWIGHLVICIILYICCGVGYVIFVVPGVIMILITLTWKLLVAFECLEVATMVESGSDVAEFDHPKWPWMAKIPMLHE